MKIRFVSYILNDNMNFWFIQFYCYYWYTQENVKKRKSTDGVLFLYMKWLSCLMFWYVKNYVSWILSAFLMTILAGCHIIYKNVSKLSMHLTQSCSRVFCDQNCLGLCRVLVSSRTLVLIWYLQQAMELLTLHPCGRPTDLQLNILAKHMISKNKFLAAARATVVTLCF